ncbi:MAG TPA: fused MFS/spermidine synthase [Candidatus Krumholzibacteria bacterium]|nr:fused MFS/spermidine synthase [Candidatus Krumholzibacteria bacterium]HRX50596.1 fused MFS/spermidine synthase [Candidatus Krumholzibacteria bacterium]
MNERIRSFLLPVLAVLAFFASGAASLIAEVTWNRMLIVVVGNSLSAAAMIIVVFMGGLGLGSFAGGRVFARRRRSLRPYVLMELGVGAYVLLSPWIFTRLEGVFLALADGAADRSLLAVARVVVSMAALLPPAFLMGATFPAMIHGATPRAAGGRSARIGYLYGANTIGAALGTFAAGYHLLLELGVRFTLNVAGGLYALAAAAALLAHLMLGREAVEESAPAAAADAVDSRPPRWAFLAAATFAVGFVSLGYEVMLTRLSILYLGNSVSVFPLVLTGFLLGSGISSVVGTWLYGLLRPRGWGDRFFGLLAAAAGAMLLLTPFLLLSDSFLSPNEMARFTNIAPRNPLPILGMIVAPTMLLGALLPVAIRMLQAEARGAATRRAATLYALNTAGGLLGAGLVNHTLVPLVGVQGTLVGLTMVLVVIGLSVLLDPRGRASRRLAVAGAAVAVGALLLLAPPRLMELYAGKLAVQTEAHHAQVKLLQEGRAAMVSVIDQYDDRLGTYRDMYLNGVEEASTRYWHVQLFKLLGILPVVTHESDGPKDAMVIAFGAGMTAGSVLASEEVASLDVVDLNPDIEGINDLFTEYNGDVYHRDRFHFHNDDGRNYLVTCGKRYDLIIGDSTHPRAYDSWILYTEEFYEAVKRRLKPDGVFAQWVPVLGSMRGELMNIHLNTFRKVFPTATLWYIYGCDQAFLMATPEPYRLDVPRLRGKLAALPEWFQAERYQIDTPERVAGFYWMGPDAMAAMSGGETRINTDDFHYFDKQSALWTLPPQRQMPAFQASAVPHLDGADAAVIEAVKKEQEVAGLLGRYGFFRDEADLDRAYCLMPENGNARFHMSLRETGRLPDPAVVCESAEIGRYRAMLRAHPDDPSVLNALASLLTEAGRAAEALPLAERAAELRPRDGAVLDTLGWTLHVMGRTLDALAVMNRAAAALPDHPIVNYHLGAVLHAAGDPDAARERLEGALAQGRSFPGAEQARVLLEGME